MTVIIGLLLNLAAMALVSLVIAVTPELLDWFFDDLVYDARPVSWFTLWALGFATVLTIMLLIVRPRAKWVWLRIGVSGAEGLRAAVLSLAAGFAVVWALQQALDLDGYYSLPEDFGFDVERRIAGFHEAIGRFVSLQVTLGFLVLAVFASMIWPGLRAAERGLAAKAWVSRLLLVMVGMLSFTFAAVETTGRVESYVRRDMDHSENTSRQARLKALRELIAIAAIERKLDSLSEDERLRLEPFGPAAKESDAPARIWGAVTAGALLATLPSAVGTARTDTPDGNRGKPHQAKGRWLPEDTAARLRLSFQQSTRMRQIKEAAQEALTTALQELLPGAERPFVKVLQQELMSGLVGGLFKGIEPPRVSSVAEARDWIDRTPRYAQALDGWTWQPGTERRVAAAGASSLASYIVPAALLAKVEQKRQQWLNQEKEWRRSYDRQQAFNRQRATRRPARGWFRFRR